MSGTREARPRGNADRAQEMSCLGADNLKNNPTSRNAQELTACILGNLDLIAAEFKAVRTAADLGNFWGVISRLRIAREIGAPSPQTRRLWPMSLITSRTGQISYCRKPKFGSTSS